MRKTDNLPQSCAAVMKSGKLNFLEPSGPVQACNGTALPFTADLDEQDSQFTFRRGNYFFNFSTRRSLDGGFPFRPPPTYLQYIYLKFLVKLIVNYPVVNLKKKIYATSVKSQQTSGQRITSLTERTLTSVSPSSVCPNFYNDYISHYQRLFLVKVKVIRVHDVGMDV